MVSHTIKYQKSGVCPPVFVAGSFTQPPWELCEMKWKAGADGEAEFAFEAEVEEGKEYQYKFKLGQNDVWDLDETMPKAFDEHGNTNNIFEAHATNESSIASDQPKRDAPVIKTSFVNSNSSPPDESPHVPSTPLFAHESLGAYDFEVVDDGFDHTLSPHGSYSQPAASWDALASQDDEADVDDPTLEKFPSNRGAVMETLRRISTSHGEEPVLTDGKPLSPRLASRRTSVESITDSLSSLGSLSPTSSRKRDSRLSHSSVDRTKSAISLGSITEEIPRTTNAAHSSDEEVSQAAEERDTNNEGHFTYTSDEGPVLKSTKVTPGQRVKTDQTSQRRSDGQVRSNEDLIDEKPKGKARKSPKHGSDFVDEARWLITGGILVLALGYTWWKSNHV